MKVLSCLNPRIIRNKYTGERIFAKCGKCKACLAAKRQKWVSLMQEESKHNKYVVFVTLDYNDDCVPFLRKEDDKLVSFPRERKVSHIREVINDYITIQLAPVTDFDRVYYSSRVYFPYARLEDLQGFIKRFRKHFLNITKDEKEPVFQKFKFFMAFEYGPRTFRPHLHGLFYFNSPSAMASFGQIVSSSWKFGHIDYSLARNKDKCCNYVAKYVYSFTPLPECYQNRAIVPKFSFSRCSNFGAGYIDENKVREILFAASPVISRYDDRKQSYGYVPLPSNLESRLFPRFTESSQVPLHARSQLYQLCEFVGKTRWSEFRLFIEHSSLESNAPFGFSMNEYFDVFTAKYLNEYFTNILHRCLKNDAGKAQFKCFDMKPLYDVYITSKRFCYNMKTFNLSADEYIKLIDTYYSRKDLYNLSEQLKCEEEFVKTHPVSDLVLLDADAYYNLEHSNFDDDFLTSIASICTPDNYPNDIKKTIAYEELEEKSNQAIKLATKKKYLNEHFNLDRFSTTYKHFTKDGIH